MNREKWLNLKTQNEWRLFIQDELQNDDNALLKAIVLLYDSQTSEEKADKMSIIPNRAGFDKIDAMFMSSIAEKIKSNFPILPLELQSARKRMKKYWKQLMKFSVLKRDKEKAKEKLYEEEMSAWIQEKQQAEELKEKMFKEIKSCEENSERCAYGICDECRLRCNFIANKE